MWVRCGSLLGFLCSGVLTPSPVLARPLDDILNCARLGARTGEPNETTSLAIEPGRPLGQTFRTGPAAEKVFRVAVRQLFWSDSWQPDEVLVLTLWDSPARRNTLGRAAIPYARRMWERSIQMFTVDARVEPSHQYYLELTVELEPLRPAETPREWLVSGKRPGTAGGDGRLADVSVAGSDYADGQAFVAGQPVEQDLWFEVHERQRRERDALYTEAFAPFDLDYPPLREVRAAAEARSWDRAVTALVKHFESRSDLIDAKRRTPKFNPSFDTREADLAVDHKALLDANNPGEHFVDLGPEWNHFQLWPERGGVGLTRGGLRKPLGPAYENTGNEKYARAFNDMLYHLFLQAPSPVKAGVFGPEGEIPAHLPGGLAGGSMWSALSIGARMLHGFHYYTAFIDSPYFTEDIRAAWIFNMPEMAEVLERMKGAGNWETQMASALFQFGEKYPEFRKSRAWFKQGFGTLVDNALRTVRPDGMLQEPTLNYHNLTLNRYSGAIEKARELKLDVPEAMNSLVEKMMDVVMHATLPDGTLPLWGDSFHPMTPDFLERGARLFGRKDFLHVATRGKEGTPPEVTSKGYEDSGFYYARTAWAPDAHYMGLRCGPYGSHGHADTLSIVAAVFGRSLLIDPGVLTYGTPESRELTATRSHSTVTIDDRDAHPGEKLAWHTARGFDFFAGRNKSYRDLPDCRHTRQVWFLKPAAGLSAVWIVLDEVQGSGERTATLRYRFAPTELEAASDTRAVRTHGEGGNLVIRVLEDDAKLEISRAIADWGGITQAPVASFTRAGALPARFTSALVPFRDKPPAVKMERLASGDTVQAVWIEAGDQAIAGCAHGFSGEAGDAEFELPDGRRMRVSGRAGVLRLRRAGTTWVPALVHGVDLRGIALDGRELAGDDGSGSVDVIINGNGEP